jgi:hypothetical protein
LLPQRTMAMAEIGAGLEPYWWAYTADGETIELEEGEREVVNSTCRVTTIAKPKVILPDSTTFLVTDRRIAWVTRDFLKGGGYSGFTPAGVITAAGMNAVSKRRAAKKREGKAAYGQVRYEWLEGLVLRSKKALFGTVDYYIDLMVPCLQGNEKIELWSKAQNGSRTVDDSLAKTLAELVLERRLALAPELRADCEEQLARVRNGIGDATNTLKAGEFGWVFPGKIEDLVDAALGKSSGM